MVTIVPYNPNGGVTAEISPAGLHSHRPVPLTIAPESEIKVTAMSGNEELQECIRTITTAFEMLVMTVDACAIITAFIVDPDPKRFDPEIVTAVPICPLEGDTETITPCSL